MNKTVFITGSRGIKELNPEAIEALDKIIVRGFEIVVGDCYGVDRTVQTYLSQKGYASHVTVYHTAKEPRNFVDSAFNHCYTPSPDLRHKNTEMAKVANYGLAIWDGHSRGTADSIRKMAEKGIYIRIVRQVTQASTVFCRVGTHPRPKDRKEPQPYPKGYRVCLFCTEPHTPDEIKAWNGSTPCPLRAAICSVTKRLTTEA